MEVKAQAGLGRALSPQPSKTSQLYASATVAYIVQQTLQLRVAGPQGSSSAVLSSSDRSALAILVPVIFMVRCGGQAEGSHLIRAAAT